MATFNERLARELIDQGHRVEIFTFSLQYPAFLFPGKTQYSDEPPPEGLDIRIRVNSINPINWLMVGRDIARLAPDYLIIRYWLPFMAPCLGSIARLVRRNASTRILAITDNVVPHEKRPADRLLTRYFLGPVHRFLCMTRSVGKDLESFGIEPSRIRISPHPLYDNFGEPLSRELAREHLELDQKQRIVLFFGFIRAYKGLDLLIRAMAEEEIRRLDVKLLVAGEFYDSPKDYHQLAQSLGLDNILWHTDFIPSARVRDYFCAADLVAQPYKTATQSGVTQVAYHFEVPMLVTAVGGLPEMVPNGIAGYVTEPEPRSIALAMADYFMQNKREELSRGIRKLKTAYSWSAFVDALINN